MKMKSILLGFAALFFVASCTEIEQNNTELQPEAKYVIYANAPETKTALDAGTGDVTWVKNDVIAVAQRGVATPTAELAQFTNTSENGTTAAFEGVALPSHNDIVAVYPASAFKEETVDGSVVNIPAVQYGVADAFPTDVSGAVVNPSYAYCASEDAEGKIVMNFKNLGGLLGFELPAYLENISEIILESASADLTGDFTLSGVESGNAKLTAKAVQKTVTLKATAADKVFKTGVKYYAAIAPVNAEGVTITLKTIVGGTFVKTAAKFPLNLPASTRRTIQLEKVVANAKVGDCFLSDGTWADASKESNGKVGEKNVIGYVLYKGTDFLGQEVMQHTNGSNMYSLNTDLQQRPGKYFHGYVLSKKINNNPFHNEKWIGNICNSKGNDELGHLLNAYTYLCYMYKGFSGGYTGATNNFDLCLGYVNSKWFRIDWYKKNWSIMASMATAPANTSGWYIPSVGDVRNIILTNLEKIKSSMTLSGNFWTSSTSHQGLDYDYPICYDFTKKVYNYQANCQDKLKVVYMLAF